MTTNKIRLLMANQKLREARDLLEHIDINETTEDLAETAQETITSAIYEVEDLMTLYSEETLEDK